MTLFIDITRYRSSGLNASSSIAQKVHNIQNFLAHFSIARGRSAALEVDRSLSTDVADDFHQEDSTGGGVFEHNAIGKAIRIRLAYLDRSNRTSIKGRINLRSS